MIIAERSAVCEGCGGKSGELQLHHWNYERLGHENDADLALLCEACHRRADRRRVRRTRRARALATYVRKKYIENGELVPPEVEEEFAAWLARKGGE